MIRVNRTLVIIILLSIFFSIPLSAGAQPKISANRRASLAVRHDGTLWKLGDYSKKQRQIGTDSDWVNVSSSDLHALAIKSDGSLWEWPYKLWPTSGSHLDRPSTRVGQDNDWAEVSAQWNYSLALKKNGTLWAWAIWGDYPGRTCPFFDRTTPHMIGKDSNWAAVAANDDGRNILALKNNGTLWAWGDNLHGELGLGDKEPREKPTRVGSERWTAVAIGFSCAVAIRQDGSLWGWGWNTFGQLIDLTGIAEFVLSPKNISADKNWVAVSTGLGHVLALKADGTLWAWGLNSYFSCGTGSRQYSIGITQVGTDTDWQDIAAADIFSLAMKKNGRLYYWGTMVGDGQIGIKYPASPVISANPFGWTTLDVGQFTSVGLKQDGTMWVWGYNGPGGDNGPGGYLGLGDTNDRSVPTPVGEGSFWKGVDSGHQHTVALKSDGTLWSWGNNRSGQCGRGKGGRPNWPIPETFNTPGQVEPDQIWKSVSAGFDHTLALNQDGILWAWGRNSEGQLGIGFDDDPSTVHARPVQVGADSDWKDISAGSYYSAALKNDGTLWAWGWIPGLGGEGRPGVPTQVGSDSDWTSIKASFYTLALKKDGSLWIWGHPAWEFSPSPQQLPKPVGREMVPWKEFSPAHDYPLGLMADGTLWTRAMAPIDPTNPMPVSLKWIQVGDDADWKTVVGSDHTTFSGPYFLGLKLDGTLMAWGHNMFGQLGIGRFGYEAVPQFVFNLILPIGPPPPPPPIPPPPDFISEVGNCSFEVNESLPTSTSHFWKGAGLEPGDKRICTTARYGRCSFRLYGNGAPKKLVQVFDKKGLSGETITIGGWSKARKPLPSGGRYGLEMKIYYSDGDAESFVKQFNKRSHGWQYIEGAVTPRKDFDRIKVMLWYAGQRGIAWFDDILLRTQ